MSMNVSVWREYGCVALRCCADVGAGRSVGNCRRKSQGVGQGGAVSVCERGEAQAQEQIPVALLPGNELPRTHESRPHP